MYIKTPLKFVQRKPPANRRFGPYGSIGGTMIALDKAVRKLQSSGAELSFVYEAGPCGYEVYRHLTKRGFTCAVVAPSMTPKRSGNRIKTDRRDARLHGNDLKKQTKAKNRF